jgi:HAD superfamily hydrolase (TIGR01509 family)
MEKFKAVLFDFDGVIGKTLEDSCRAWAHACTEAGLTFDAEEFYLCEGMKSTEYAGRLFARHGRDPEGAASLVSRKNELYSSNNQFSFYVGIETLVQRLQDKGIKIGVVSGGSRARLLSGRSGQLLKHVDVVVTGDELTQGKPAPEGYRKAAEALKVAPDECLVIENAPLGIQSAKNAGMSCIGVCSTLSQNHLQSADRVVADHTELLQLFIEGNALQGSGIGGAI